ncbi:DUF2975 domain-containing protein [Sporosarcina sp. OR05]|uniref:DUF2975 domain-containing protein n=1 Tax=Sporosarcina sp. OR05 TaxID=2969819 RepID=UPI00352A007A
MKRETLFLKLIVILMGLPVLALCIFVVPKIGSFAAELVPSMPVIKLLVLIVMYAAAIPFFLALYQTFKLLNFIDNNEAFSDKSAKALRNIKHCALSISGFYVLGMPLFYVMGELDDAPGIILIGLLILFGALVIAVFAAVLEKLVTSAIEMKSENDLTV